MTARPRTFLLLFSTLFVGIAIGSSLNGVRLTKPLQADPVPSAPAAATDRNPLLEGSELMSRISSMTTPAVVHIQSERREGGKRIEETGSGVLIKSPTTSGIFAVTNSHVIRGATFRQIGVHTSNGMVYNPTRVWEDRATDIAVIQLPVNDLPTARWGDSDRTNIGHVVLAMGSPFGLSRSVTFGIISAKGRRDLALTEQRTVINQDFLQTDAAINPGNSGGPLISLHGEIIGINTAIASNSGGNEGIGFSIPSNLVRRVVESLLEHGEVRRAYLGVKLDDNFSLESARRLGLDRVQGARIIEVYNKPATPASRAGLRYDDVVMSINGVDVLDENHLINLVSLTDVNSRASLVVLRGRRRVSMEVVLTQRGEAREARTPARK